MSATRTPLGRLGLLGSLYFAQGLPFGFFTQALPLLLRGQGYSLTEVGLSSLLAIPWALKFAWAPALDRFYSPRIGRRRSWILPMQLAATVTLLLLALPMGRSMAVLMTATFALNLIAATQDIATDGLAVELLRAGERGLANGLQVAGYRVGMIVGGGVLLVLHDRLGAPVTFVAMAALTALASMPVLRLHEPPPVADEPSAPGAPAVHFLRLPHARQVLAVIVVYKAGEAFATGMLRPFLHDAGMSLADVGWMIGTVGFVAGMLGALAGGSLVNRMGRRPALLGFGVLQAATVAGYAAVALTHPGRPVLYAFCAVEHFVGGMATAALFTCMMDWSRPAHAATDYTVQASAVVVATGLAAVLSGASAQALGYPLHFAAAALLSIVGVAVVALSFPQNRQPA